MSKFVEVGKLAGMADGSLRSVQVNGQKVVLVRLGDDLFALKDECSHEEFPLSEGWVEDGRLSCAFHGAKFDPKTGEALSLPAYESVKTFAVRVQNGTIEISVE
jgi:3-phenylpropionate/trans-cinnamate dioxygenase ferredoxin component